VIFGKKYKNDGFLEDAFGGFATGGSRGDGAAAWAKSDLCCQSERELFQNLHGWLCFLWVWKETGHSGSNGRSN
jgi:hypothetical protein